MISSVQKRKQFLSEAKKVGYTARGLGYAYAALEPYIDAETMRLHYSQHYMGYLDKLNAALPRNLSMLGRETVEKLLYNFKDLPNNISKDRLEDIKFNAGGVDNHNVFWKNIAPNGPEQPDKQLKDILKIFGTITQLKASFKERALAIKGSGWCWLVKKDDQLSFMATSNQDSPRLTGHTPILGLDMWEHAYYLKHKNDKEKYVDDFWKVVNWNDVWRRYLES